MSVQLANPDLRVCGLDEFPDTLLRFHMLKPIAHIPRLTHVIHGISPFTQTNYDVTRLRMLRESEKVWLVLAWHARLGGERTNPNQPDVLSYAVEFI